MFTLLIKCSCISVFVNFSLLVRFYCQCLVYDKTFFLLFMGVGSSCLESTIVLFLLLPSGITGFSKSQLVSSCCCLATLYSHKDFSTSLWHHLYYFVFSVPLEGMCRRGMVPSCTELLETLTFHLPIFLFLILVWEKWKGWQGSLALLSLTAPPPQCMITLWGT